MKDIRTQWKALAATKKITRGDIAALCIYRAMVKEQVPNGAKSRLHKAFTPITNSVKLANGAAPRYALETAIFEIRYSTFAKWLDPEGLSKLLDAARTTKSAGLE